MNKFATGLITGSVIGAIGLSYAMRDKKMRKKMARDGRRVLNKANDIVENISDMF